MSNLDTVNALITAINLDRFAEIQALHRPDAVFSWFGGPTLHDAVSIADWHRAFLRDYADCNYAEVESIEDGDVVCVRATIEAKGYDWRAFTQRVLEVFRFEEGELAERRLYGMHRDLELDKPSTAAMENALGYRGGSPAETRTTTANIVAAFRDNDAETAKGYFSDKAVLIDGVYGIAVGWENGGALSAARPRPAFGVERVTNVYAGDHNAVLESSFDPGRPRKAEWVRFVDGKVLVDEVYWMMREIGMRGDENYARDRHARQVILPT